MALSRAAEDALFALFAVKQDFVSESAVEKALGQLAAGQSLESFLVDKERMTAEQAERVRGQLDPEVIQGYRIEGEAGRGGMGVVYRARQLSMDRIVALKVLARRLSRDESYVAKFLDEARAAAKLNHENIVAAIDAGESNGLHYFAMEFVEGDSVSDILEAKDPQAGLPWEQSFEIAEQVARGLEHAHNAGIVHRDVKPENIMLGGDGPAKLCDLGLAKPAQEAGTGEKSAMTEGTPYYCSPEQALGRTDIDPASDVYSLGVTLFHMMKGAPPFDGETARAILLQHVKSPFPDLAKAFPDVPEPLRRVMQRMVIKDREKRMPTMRAFREELIAARKGLSARAKRPAGTKGGAAPLVVGGLSGAPLAAAVGGAFLLALLLSAAVVNTLRGTSDVAQDDKTALEKTEPKVDTPRRPVVVRAGKTSGRNDPTPREEDPELEKARKLLSAAVAYEREHGSDPNGALERYRKVTREHAGTRYASQADVRMAALRDRLKRESARALDALTKGVLGLIARGRYRSAAELVKTFRATWAARGISGLETSLKKIDRSINLQAKATLERALANAESGGVGAAEAVAKVRGLLAQMPEDLATSARARLVRLGQAEARKAWGAVQDKVDRALREQNLAEARRLLRSAEAKPEFAPFKAEVSSELSDLQGLERASQVFVRNLQALGRRPSAILGLAAGGRVEGKLAQLDTRRWTARVGSRALDLRDVAAKQLVELALPPREGRYSAMFFALAGFPRAAQLALDQFVRIGGRDDAALRARIKRLMGGALERRAKLLIDPLLSTTAAPEQVLKGIKRLPAMVRGTQAYRARYKALQDAYVRARVSEILTAESRIFHGEYKKEKKRRKAKVTLRYDFSAPGQLNDWTPDLRADPKSKVELKGGAALMRGKVTLEARFQGKGLRVALRVSVKNRRSPNVNVILSNNGTWQGILCGAGFRYNLIRNIKVDAAARKRAGYVVDLPAHVVIILSGDRPRRRMPEVLAAEERPAIKKKDLKVLVQRTRKGTIKLKVGSTNAFPYTVGPVPKWDTPGNIAIAPFDSELIVREVVVTGRLDPGWAAKRAQGVARVEANRLPAPAKPGGSK